VSGAGESRTADRGSAGVSAAPSAHEVASAAVTIGAVVSVNTSEKTGVQKSPRESIELVAEHGVAGDAHAGPWHRQVSLLAIESVEKMRAAGADVAPGAFGENVTTSGLVLYELPVGTRMELGGCPAEVTQIGKECHSHCAIFHQVGDCVMPREGIFVRLLGSGMLRAGDPVRVLGPIDDGVAAGDPTDGGDGCVVADGPAGGAEDSAAAGDPAGGAGESS
jgi:MOSC domain-containing protein YiiM